MATKTSKHILPTSANLLGFCLFIIASMHVLDKAQLTFIDEFASVIAFLLTVCSLFSFISIRAEENETDKKFELIADYLFIFSLIGIAFIIILIVVGIIK